MEKPEEEAVDWRGLMLQTQGGEWGKGEVGRE